MQDHQKNETYTHGPVSPISLAAMELAAQVAAVREEVRVAKGSGGGEATDADLTAAVNHLSEAIGALSRLAGRELSLVPAVKGKLADAIVSSL